MGFFKEFKEDFSEALDDLVPGAENSEAFEEDDEDLMVNTFDTEEFNANLEALNNELNTESTGLFESAAKANSDETGADTDSTEDVAEEVDTLEEAANDETLSDESVDTFTADSYDATVPDEASNETDNTDDLNENTEDAMSDTNEITEEVTTETHTEDSNVQFYGEPVKFEPETPIDIEKIFGETENDDEMAVITKGMTITGDLESLGSVELRGVINGNVKTNGKMVISGKIKGNSTAKEFFADSAHVNGEVHSEGSVKVGNGSVIVGNIIATSAVIAGAVKGDLDVKGPVIIDTTAVIVGNIKSKSVQINNGAVIEGFCSQAYSDINVDDVFGKDEG